MNYVRLMPTYYSALHLCYFIELDLGTLLDILTSPRCTSVRLRLRLFLSFFIHSIVLDETARERRDVICKSPTFKVIFVVSLCRVQYHPHNAKDAAIFIIATLDDTISVNPVVVQHHHPSHFSLFLL